MEKSQKLDVVGAYFENQINFKSLRLIQECPKINSDGVISMNQEHYFYAKNTSLLINHCAFKV